MVFYQFITHIDTFRSIEMIACDASLSLYACAIFLKINARLQTIRHKIAREQRILFADIPEIRRKSVFFVDFLLLLGSRKWSFSKRKQKMVVSESSRKKISSHFTTFARNQLFFMMVRDFLELAKDPRETQKL